MSGISMDLFSLLKNKLQYLIIKHLMRKKILSHKFVFTSSPLRSRPFSFPLFLLLLLLQIELYVCMEVDLELA